MRSLFEILSKRYCQENSSRDLCREYCHRALVHRSCQENCSGDLVPRPGEESAGLPMDSLATGLASDPLQRSSVEISYRHLVTGSFI